MSVNTVIIGIASITSAAVGYWASTLHKDKIKQSDALVETLRDIPEYPVSCLKSLLDSLPNQSANKLVFLRGVALPRCFANDIFGRGCGGSGFESCCDDLPLSDDEPESSPCVSVWRPKDGQPALVVEKLTKHIYHQRSNNFLGYDKEVDGTKVLSRTLRQFPFIIADQMSKPCNDYVVVSIEGDSDIQLSLEKVFSNRKELFTRSENGYELQVDEVKEESLLPVGNIVSVVGVFTSENGIPTMKPSIDVPYFITSKTKNELIAELNSKLENIKDMEKILAQLSIGLYGFAIGVFASHIIRQHCATQR